ncbi:MAG: chemotaxis protein CheW [Gemmatimonadaceae bacterium]
MAPIDQTAEPWTTAGGYPADAAEVGDLAAARRALLFAVAGRLYGCEIETVREILPVRRCTRLPGAPPFVLGLINLRGTVVTVVDLALRLGVGRGAAAEGSIVVVDLGTRVAGLAVDEVRDVVPLRPDEMDAGGAAGADGYGALPDAVRGLARVGEASAVLLDVQSIVRQVLV